MKILVTGGAGYIGSLLCPKLLEDGHDVTLLDRFLWGLDPILYFAQHPRLTVLKMDILAPEVPKLLSNFDIIIHLAAVVGFPACAADPDRAHRVNLWGTQRLLREISKDQVFIFASTGSTYGLIDGVCTEDSPTDPLTVYGRTKKEAEKFCLEKDGIVLRFATVFGVSPRLRLDLLVNDFCYQAVHHKQIILYEGHHKRTFIHVKDAVQSYLFTISNREKMQGSVFNVGSEQLNYSKRDVALEIQKAHSFYLYEADVGKDFDQRNYDVSYQKIRNLGFETSLSLRDGIEELLRVIPLLDIRGPYRNI